MKGKLIAVFIAFFLFVVLYAVEVSHISRYLHFKRFWLVALGVGLLVGVVSILLTRKKVPQKGLERTQIRIAIVSVSIVLLPLLMSLSNRLLSFRTADAIQVEYVSEEGRYGGRGLIEGQQYEPTFYHLFFYWENRLYRIAYAESHFGGTAKGEMIGLPRKKGLWGFDWVALK